MLTWWFQVYFSGMHLCCVKMIRCSVLYEQGTFHSKLMDAIKPHVPVLRTSPYGKKILSSNILKK